MANKGLEINAALFQDRRVQIGLAVVAVLIIAALVFLFLPQNTETASVSSPAAGVPEGPTPGYPGGYPGAAGTVPGVPTDLGGTPAGVGGVDGATGPKSNVPNSFSKAPEYPGLGQGGATNGFGGGGGFPGAGGYPGAGGFGGGAAAGPTSPKPKGTKEGTRVVRARLDPFVSFYKFVPLRQPAYELIVPTRLATYPKVEVASNQNVEDILGPLPATERRVAGVLYNGAVTAILENGPAGSDDVQVIQPGSRVRSYIAGVGDLTVESITATQVTLRADDNRRVIVPLSGLPAGVAEQLRGTGQGAVGGGLGGDNFGGGGGRPAGPTAGGAPTK